jgi:hypothetical protein
VLYWLAKLRESKYEEHLALLREAEQKQIEIRDQYAAHNKKWTSYILQRKIALGLALEEDIRDYSHTPTNKDANDEIDRYPSDEHESKENPEKAE